MYYLYRKYKFVKEKTEKSTQEETEESEDERTDIMDGKSDE